MSAPREFEVAIIGKGSCWTISLQSPFKFGVLKELIVLKFGLVHSEANTLELRRVDEEPNDENAEELFNAPTPTGSSRKINTTELLNAGVQYIVGKIAEQPSE